jgi:pyruvate kinase
VPPHPEVFAVLKPGLPLLIDDGKLRLEVERTGDGYAIARVKVGGRLSERKGVNIPDEIIPLSPLTAKDRRDLEYGSSSAPTGSRCRSSSVRTTSTRRAR